MLRVKLWVLAGARHENPLRSLIGFGWGFLFSSGVFRAQSFAERNQSQSTAMFCLFSFREEFVSHALSLFALLFDLLVDCDKGGPNPAKTRVELLNYLRDSFTALKKSLGAITAKNMYDPIERPGPNTRLGLGDCVHLARGGSLWPDGYLSARKRHCATSKPAQSPRN